MVWAGVSAAGFGLLEAGCSDGLGVLSVRQPESVAIKAARIARDAVLRMSNSNKSGHQQNRVGTGLNEPRENQTAVESVSNRSQRREPTVEPIDPDDFR
jgi:hypothetical protein